MATVRDSGLEALEKLKSTEPPVFLAPSSISEEARAALQYLFTKLKPHNPKSPFDQLLVDGFDAEQIWQQIDMQSQPVLSSLRQEVKRFATNPAEIRKLGKLALKGSHEDEMDMDEFDSGDDEDEDQELEANESQGEEEEEEDDGEDEEEEEEKEEEENDEVNKGIEDKFFKIKVLGEFLEDVEAEEYGIDYKNKKGVSKEKKQNLSDDDDEDSEEDDDDEDEDEEVRTYPCSGI